MVMEAQTSCPASLQAGPFKYLLNGMDINGPSINGLNINGSELGDTTNHHNYNNNSNHCSSSASISSASVHYSTPSSPSISLPCQSPRPMHSPVFFQTNPPASLPTPRSPNLVSYTQPSPQHVCTSQASPHHVYISQTTPHHVYTSQHNLLASHHCPSAGQGWYPSNTIIINPAGATPGHGGGGDWITPVGCASSGRITPGRMTPGRVTPVYTMAMKKRYVDIMLASTASTVAIDNKIEQAMDLVKSHLMFAVREEVDVLKERIGELMERINHLEYENTVLRKYATQEALQQIQQQHGGAPNP